MTSELQLLDKLNLEVFLSFNTFCHKAKKAVVLSLFFFYCRKNLFSSKNSGRDNGGDGH